MDTIFLKSSWSSSWSSSLWSSIWLLKLDFESQRLYLIHNRIRKRIKTYRYIESSSISCADVIKLLIRKKKINNIIQIGANDGKSDDFLRSSINIDTNLLLVEPIKSAFDQLGSKYVLSP